MVTDSVELQPARDRAVRLFTYLKELTELRSSTIRTLESYDKVIWLADLPRYWGCYSASWFDARSEEGGDEWIEIGKPSSFQSAPTPPQLLIPWLHEKQILDSSLDFPQLREAIEKAGQEDEAPEEGGAIDEQVPDTQLFLRDHPDVQQRWERYIDEEWLPWAEDDRQRRAMHAIYADLFGLYQRQQRLGEQFEVVLGLGLLNWRTSNGQVVRRHLLTAQISIEFDPVNGTMTVGPAGEGAKLLLEQDMLEPEERPDVAEQRKIANQIEAIGDDIWQEDRLDDVLSSWVNAISPGGRYEKDSSPNTPLARDPVVRFAPALILRRRTERSLIRTFQDIIDLLEDGVPVPFGVQRLVDVVDDASPDEEPREGDKGVGQPVDDVYFPLPANEEQLEIVRRLQTRQGVLVQGPPGTGKSHTIANLLSHLLATGHRVLVTSHTARALRVLHEKLPQEIAPLCVSLLGDDRVALEDLEASVVGITERFNYWNARESAIEIENLERQLDVARRKEAVALDALLKLREADVRVHNLAFGAYIGTSEAIARRVADEAQDYSWIQVRPVESQPSPLQNDQALRLLHLLREISPDRKAELSLQIPSSASLLSPDEVADLMQKERDLKVRARTSNLQVQNPAVEKLSQTGHEILAQLSEELADLQRCLVQLTQIPARWINEATTQTLAGHAGAWRQLAEMTFKHLAAIDAADRQSQDRDVAGLDGRDPKAARIDAQDLLVHLMSGKRLGFGPLRPEPVKRAQYILEDVRIDGRRCDNPQTLQDLVAWLDLVDHVAQLQREWSAHVEPPVGSATVRIAAFRDLLDQLNRILALSDQVAALRRKFESVPGVSDVPLGNVSEVLGYAKTLDAAAWNVRMGEVQRPIRDLELDLEKIVPRPSVHALTARLHSSLKSRNSSSYASAYAEVLQMEEGRRELAEQQELLRHLSAHARPIAEALVVSCDDPSWEKRLESFTSAWDWARADLWLRNSQDPKELERRSHELQQCRDQIRFTIGKLASAKAWRHTFRRMTENERQHLMAWMQAMRRIGRGTGKYAAQYRREAREHMESCRSAIPAWVMPIYRVAESVRPGKDAFDVVIVDEASQSGPEALFLQFIAKQMVVVGDDKQISPDFVGMDRGAVDALRSRNIPDLPFKDALGVDNSFFDQAAIRFGGRIRLREHFRCMPEIIQFSNNLVYRSEPLIPLRQYGRNRLPPIMTAHVEDGYRKGERNVVNPPEAQAIVEQIKVCCNDPAYAGKSIGVISLQGDAQAREIERLLLDAIGPEEMARHDIVCGDAYAFQGDERDIIFLSLVAASSENHRIGAMTHSRDERRFNVAASRARDQVWLFHTATLDDLSPTCMRYHLLSYYLNPRMDSVGSDIIVRDRAQLQEPFDSLFEQGVFLRIQERGYRVLPQVNVAGYRIDLVVEGISGRLAVECDGDRWHGPEQHARDTARQRDLERYGWRFWRVRGSSYYRDPDEALEGLWKMLDSLDIHPTSHPVPNGTGDGAGNVVGIADSRQTDVMDPLEQPGADAAAFPEFPCSESFVETEPILKPYKTWNPRPLPDPLTTTMSEVLDSLIEIIADEGPVQCQRVYRIYAAAAEIGEGSHSLRSVLNKTLYRGVRLGLLADRDETGSLGQIDRFVRLAESPAVVVRERGDRSLEEIPQSEIAAAMARLAESRSYQFPDDANELLELLLHAYGIETEDSSQQREQVLARALAFASAPFEDERREDQLPLDLISAD